MLPSQRTIQFSDYTVLYDLPIPLDNFLQWMKQFFEGEAFLSKVSKHTLPFI